MPGNGVTARSVFSLGALRSRGTLHYILQWAIMLDKVEVRGSNRQQRHTEISNHGNRFQENLRKNHRGSPVEINTLRVHLPDQSTEKAEVAMGCGTDGSGIGSAVHVRRVCADSDVNGHGYSMPVGGGQDTEIREWGVAETAGKKLASSFAVADAEARGDFRDLVDVFAGFVGHAELTGAEASVDIFRSVADEGDFEIVDERGTVHGDAGDEAAAHQVDEHGPQTDFDDVASDAPEDGAALLTSGVNGGEEIAKIGGGEEVRQAVEKFGDGGI